jgi:WD40 repeat protein
MTTYKIGGGLPANAPTYVVRQADRDLERYLQAGGFCYILNSRQMGKSSLKLRAMRRLQAEGVNCAEIDLTGVGAEGVSAQQWYDSIADELATQFDLEAELATFWDRHGQLSDIKRLAKFIDTILLERIDRKIVIFIDEIDKVIGLGAFTDDLFGLIRSCAERQARSPKYQRLSFVLIGVAAPTDLIENKQCTPFNIGQAIELTGFQLTDDLTPLTNGLVGKVANPAETIGEILYWTGGQPFLTQKICQLVVESPHAAIADIVCKYIIENWEYQDNPVHLKTIANRLLGNQEKASYLLEQYRQIIIDTASIDLDRSPAQQLLRLSGLVVEREGRLRVYNPIYAHVFNLDWIDRELANICPHALALLAWIDAKKPKQLLLRGTALEEALEWRNRHPQLSGDHYDFLSQSQKQKSDRELKKIKSRIKKLLGIFICVLISIGFLLFTIVNIQTIDRLDRVSNQIMGQYEFAPVDALKAAIINAEKFQNRQPILWSNSTPTPKLALQKLVDSIQEIDEINTYQHGINAVYFCQNNRIFTAGSNGTINVWDRRFKDDRKSREIINLGADLKVYSVSYPSSECAGIFATASSDGKIRLWKWNERTPVPMRAISETIAHQPDNDSNEGGVQNVRLTQKDRYIFSSGKTDGKLKKWRIEDDFKLTLVWERLAHENGVISLNLSGIKDRRIGTSGKDGTAKIWDLEGNLLVALTGHRGAVNSINFCSTVSPACGIAEIATSSNDGTVRLWQADGKFIKTIVTHTGEVRAVRFSPDGRLLATASAKDSTTSNGSSVRIWQLKDGELITEFKGHHGTIESIRFKPQNGRDKFQQLATTGQDDSTIRIWKIPAIRPIANRHQAKITSVRFDPIDPNYFVTAAEDGTIRWWSHQLNSLPISIDTFDRYYQQVKFKTIRMIHPLGQQLTIAVGDSKGIIRLLKIEDRAITEVNSFDTCQGDLNSMDWNYHPDRHHPSRYLLATTGTIDKDIKVWSIDIKSRQRVSRSPVFEDDWNYHNLSIRFSEDGENLAIGGDDGRGFVIKNINLDRQNNIKKIPFAFNRDVKDKVAIRFSNDNQSMAIVSQEGKIWRSDMSGNLLDSNPVETYQAGTENASFSQDDRSIATGGAGSALRLWDLQGRQIADFRGYWGTIRSINFSKDGKYLLAGGDDGIPSVWQTDRDIPTLVRQGCQWLQQGYLRSHVIDPQLQNTCAAEMRDRSVTDR